MAEEKKGFFAEFKTFVSRGNVVDMAIGIIIGGLFTAIVNSFVKDILNPILGLILGGTDLGKLKAATETTEELAIRYGNLLQNIIQFLLTALVLFCLVRAINRMREKADAELRKRKQEPEEQK